MKNWSHILPFKFFFLFLFLLLGIRLAFNYFFPLKSVYNENTSELIGQIKSLKIEGDLKEFITNLENSLDIIELLWENIVLEIPLKYTKVEDLSKFHGDGWKLVSEEEATTSHNPFNELLKNIEEE